MAENSVIDYNSLTDAELIALGYDGDRQAITVLHGRFNYELVSYFLRQTGDRDCAGDLTSKTWQKIIMVKPSSRYSTVKHGVFSKWVFTIRKRVLIDFVREEKRRVKVFREQRAKDDGGEEFPDLDNFGGESERSYIPSAEHEASAVEPARQILECLPTLPQREAIALRCLWFGDDKTPRLIKEGDIAQVMGLSFSHFSELKEKALKNLERCLAQRGYAESSKFILALRVKVK